MLLLLLATTLAVAATAVVLHLHPRGNMATRLKVLFYVQQPLSTDRPTDRPIAKYVEEMIVIYFVSRSFLPTVECCCEPKCV